jgi:hypothetical protein
MMQMKPPVLRGRVVKHPVDPRLLLSDARRLTPCTM